MFSFIVSVLWWDNMTAKAVAKSNGIDGVFKSLQWPLFTFSCKVTYCGVQMTVLLKKFKKSLSIMMLLNHHHKSKGGGLGGPISCRNLRILFALHLRPTVSIGCFLTMNVAVPITLSDRYNVYHVQYLACSSKPWLLNLGPLAPLKQKWRVQPQAKCKSSFSIIPWSHKLNGGIWWPQVGVRDFHVIRDFMTVLIQSWPVYSDYDILNPLPQTGSIVNK